jgi:hypothetical protein
LDNQDLLFDGVVGCLAHFRHTFALLQNSLEIESPAIACGALLLLASQTGFEPVTYGLEVRCSIQLSYWDVYGSGRENTTCSIVKLVNN